jgi:Rod binding domain-containing protein
MNTVQRTIAAMHAVHGGVTSNRAPLTEHEKLVRNTQKWVAQTFYWAMLKEMRKSPFHNEEFEGGRDGEAYEEMFDQRIADRMSQSAGSTLVNSIVDRIEAKRDASAAHSPRQIIDATTAYARATRRGKPGEKPAKENLPDRHPDPQQRKPAMPNGRRRQQKILPELMHVTPTR